MKWLPIHSEEKTRQRASTSSSPPQKAPNNDRT